MNFVKENKLFIFLLLAGALCLSFSSGHIADIYNDIGRELYYPYAILEKKVLYKDLFCIYPPLSYLLNAVLYKISFGANLGILYFASGFFSLMSVFLIYVISKKFLTNFASLSIVFFILATGVFSTRIFNFTLPYSFGIVYGLGFFLLSLFFLLKFGYDNKNKYMYLSSLFLGLSLCSKYEFAPFAVIFSIVLISTKNIKLILKSFLISFSAFIFPFLFLFLQGLTFQDLIQSSNLISLFVKSKPLKTFYITQGVYFTPKIIYDWSYKIIWGILAVFTAYLGCKTAEKKKTLGYLIIALTCALIFLFFHDTSYLYLTFVTIIIFLLLAKFNSKAQNLVILSCLAVSLKSIWGLSYSNYGLYYTGIVLLSFFILISNFKEKNLIKAVSIVLIAAGINALYLSLLSFKFVDTKISSKRGEIYTIDEYAKTADKVITFINNLEEDNPKVMIFPEGLALNFLAIKKNNPEGFYNSLIPLYTEAFGDKVINYYKSHLPDYIIFSDIKMTSYGYGSICDTYAQTFCTFVFENYSPLKMVEGAEDKFYILQRRD